MSKLFGSLVTLALMFGLSTQAWACKDKNEAHRVDDPAPEKLTDEKTQLPISGKLASHERYESVAKSL